MWLILENWQFVNGNYCLSVCAVLSHSPMSDSLQPRDCSQPGSSAPGESAGKNTEMGLHAFLQGIFPTQVSHTAGRIFTAWATREAYCVRYK